MNNQKTLFLGWRDPREHRWYPVGRLDVDDSPPQYSFRYTQGAADAAALSGFAPLYDFPHFNHRYTSSWLFPLFKNRVMNYQRRSFYEYLSFLDIVDESPDPLEILAVDGGYRVTDNFQVFPKIRKQPDGSFSCRFFLHGWRHTNTDAQAAIDRLEPDDRLFVTIELTNPQTTLAVQIQTTKYHMIGWAPRYLVNDLVTAMAHAPGDYRARVVKVNRVPAPSKQRVLIELSGHWPQGYEPMEADEFKLLRGKDAPAASLGGQIL